MQFELFKKLYTASLLAYLINDWEKGVFAKQFCNEKQFCWFNKAR